MNDQAFGIQTVLTLAVVVVSLAALFFIVRGAVLSALNEHYRRVQRAEARREQGETA